MAVFPLEYHQLINVNTRIAEKSAPTIDLFVTNNKENYTHSGFVTDIGIIYALYTGAHYTRVNTVLPSAQRAKRK